MFWEISIQQYLDCAINSNGKTNVPFKVYLRGKSMCDELWRRDNQVVHASSLKNYKDSGTLWWTISTSSKFWINISTLSEVVREWPNMSICYDPLTLTNLVRLYSWTLQCRQTLPCIIKGSILHWSRHQRFDHVGGSSIS